MRYNKKFMLILIVLIVSVLSMACMDKVEEEVGSKIGEKIVEKTTGGENVDIDRENENVSVETEEGSFKAGENLEWPEDDMGDLPIIEGKVMSISQIDDDNTTSVIIEIEDMKTAKAYLQDIIDLGYVEGSLEETDSSFVNIYYQEDSHQATISYFDMFKSITIMYSKNSEQAIEFFENN